MRLIDVDKLKADVEWWENHDDPKKPDYDARDIEQVIGFQPIVEAIPVSFLERLIFEAKQSKELLKEEYRYFTSIYGHTIKPITCDQAISLIEGIIDYWQDKKQRGKENAGN